jgi:hypothetical protein
MYKHFISLFNHQIQPQNFLVDLCIFTLCIEPMVRYQQLRVLVNADAY